MKRERGSASVLALIMLLFLAFAGGSWVMMLAHENATALSDEKEQQAWYAAEAGMKRAKIELEAKNSDWAWLTSEEKFSKDNFDYQKVNNNQNDPYAKYGVFIASSGSTFLISGAPTTGTAYDITSVGEYMGTTKVIKDTFTPLPSGGGGAHGDTDLVEKESKPIAANALVATGGTLTVSNSVNDKAGVIGSTYSSKTTDSRGNKKDNPITSDDISTLTGLYTKIADSVFEESTYGTFTQVTTVVSTGTAGGNETPLTLSKNQLTKVNWPIQYQNNNGATGNFNRQIIGASGSVLYFYLQGSNDGNWLSNGNIVVYTTDGINGPTSLPPMILIFDKDVTIGANDLTGNICIIGKGKVRIGNTGKVSGNIMIIANDDVTVDCGSTEAKYFISSDGNVIINSSCSKFIGQIQAAGDVTLNAEYNEYNNYVSTNFAMPTMELHGS